MQLTESTIVGVIPQNIGVMLVQDIWSENGRYLHFTRVKLLFCDILVAPHRAERRHCIVHAEVHCELD